MQSDSSVALKVNRSRLYTLWFGWYSRRQFRRFFNSVRVFMNPQTPLMERGVPVVFYANHAYWWDGFWSQLCTENFFTRTCSLPLKSLNFVSTGSLPVSVHFPFSAAIPAVQSEVLSMLPNSFYSLQSGRTLYGFSPRERFIMLTAGLWVF